MINIFQFLINRCLDILKIDLEIFGYKFSFLTVFVGFTLFGLVWRGAFRLFK